MHRARCVAIAGGERMRSREKKKLARTQRNIKGRGCGRGGAGGGRPSCSRNHRRRSRAHNLPIGTLHYSCLQLQPANQPGSSPARILSPAPVHCCIPPIHPWFLPRCPLHAPLFASIKFSCSPRGGFELTINFVCVGASLPYKTVPISDRLLQECYR